MSKFSYLLILTFIISSCAHQSQKIVKNNTDTSTTETTAVTSRPADVQVDKESNSIKITQPENSGTAAGKLSAKKMKPRFQFDWPVWEARMTRGFLPHGTKKRKRPHKGIDLAAPRGTAVMASHDGKVIYTGKGFKGYGKMIMIESPNGWATLYGHLDKIIVSEGVNLRQGEVIGALGNTGRSSGPHLHFEIRKLDGPVDPLPLLPAGEALTNEVDNGAIEE